MRAVVCVRRTAGEYVAGGKPAASFTRCVAGQGARFGIVPGAAFQARDDVSGNTWTLEGRAVAGGLEGSSLDFVVSYISEWYGWAAYHPATGKGVLLRNPARLTGNSGRHTSGTELTYHVNDDRLLVLGSGANRSYSYRPRRQR